MAYLFKTLIYIDVLVAAGLFLFRWALLPRHRGLVSRKIVAIALITPAIALLCHNVYFFFAYLAALIAFNSRSRVELAGVFLFMLPSMPLLSIDTRIGGMYLFAISVVSAMGFGALVAALTTRGRPMPRAAHYDVAMWVIVALVMFINQRSLVPTDILRALVQNVLLFIGPYLLVSRAVRNAADIERLLLYLSLGATLMAVTACYQCLRHWILFESYYQALNLGLQLHSSATALRGGLLRSGGSMVDYSAGGLFLATIVTLLPLLRRSFRPAGYWTILAITLAGLFATQSRGAWVAAMVGAVVMAGWQRQWTRLAVVAGGLALVEAVVALLPASSRLSQILGHSGAAQGTADYRQDLATQGLALVRAHPLLGQSPDQILAALSNLRQGEHIIDIVNSHLYVAMAAGIPIFLVWCAIWLMPVVDGWRQRDRGNVLAAVPVAIMAPALVALTFTSMGDRNLTWMVIAMALAAPCLAFSSRRQGRVTATPVDARPVVARVPSGPLAPVRST